MSRYLAQLGESAHQFSAPLEELSFREVQGREAFIAPGRERGGRSREGSSLELAVAR